MSKDVRFFNPSKFYLANKEKFDTAIQRVLESGGLVLGSSEEITKFEENFARYTGAKHCVASGSGTQSLCLAYKAAGIGAGDEVITTSHTFIATIDQIKHLGAVPVLVDIGSDGLIDPMLVEKAVTPRTKAIVPVHLEGKVCQMEAIMEIAKRFDLIVIEDAAQAVGARFGGKHVGTIGIAGCFSFFPAKILGSFGNGGAVITNDDRLAEKMRLMRCNGNIGKNPDLDAPLGWNLEPDAVQCAVLNVILEMLDDRLKRRREIAGLYNQAFESLTMTLPMRQEGRVYQDYVVRLSRPVIRDSFAKFLKEKGIGALGHNLTPNHWYNALEAHFRLPKTDEYVMTQCRIPCNADMTDEEVRSVIDVVKEFHSKSWHA